MKRSHVLAVTILLIFCPFLVQGESQGARQEPGMEWLSVQPLAVSTAAYESPSRIDCYLGLAFETNGTRDAGVARTVHCANIVAVAALVTAEVADGDAEKIKLSFAPSSSRNYKSISHILINGTDYKLAD